jgi:hypothetical protein
VATVTCSLPAFVGCTPSAPWCSKMSRTSSQPAKDPSEPQGYAGPTKVEQELILRTVTVVVCVVIGGQVMNL